jgi:iron complex transport system ATP-binding protein
MTIIELSDVKIGYTARRGPVKQIGPIINFNASKGELIALIGSNGIGKSTLLRTLIQLQSSLAGKLSFFGKPQTDLNRNEFSTLISFVSTEPVRVSNLSVYQLVSLGRFPYTNWMGQLSAQDKRIVEESLALVNLMQLKDLHIDEISDGERQRAMIARALAQNTPIILLDEPTAYLDIINKYGIIQLLLNLAHSKQKTIIFSTHELNIAISQVDKIWLMNNNNVNQGAPEDLILNNSFSDIFGNKLEFNWQSGTFRQVKIANNRIALKCDQGTIYDLVSKALDRINFSIDNSSDKSIEVIAREKEYLFIVREFTKQTELKSIYELCRILREK